MPAEEPHDIQHLHVQSTVFVTEQPQAPVQTGDWPVVTQQPCQKRPGGPDGQADHET